MLFRTEKFYDLVGGLSFVAGSVVCICFRPFLGSKETIGILMMNLWATRMALFLFYRAMKMGGDSRFEKIKLSCSRFFMAWFIQALWITLTGGPVYAMILNNNKYSTFGLKEIGGIVLYIAGHLIQVIADQQKLNFKMDPKNKGKFIRSGLWSYSRHPNYVGDILLWAGISLFCVDSLNGAEKYASLICPVFTYLLLSKVSGVNLLEKKADKTWGGQPDYEEYKRTTPVLFPGMGTGSNANSTAANEPK